MNALVLDSDIFIDQLRGHPPAKELFTRLFEKQSITYCSTITELELFSARDCENTTRRQETSELLDVAIKIPVTSQIARTAADFRRKYGTSIPDSIIASTAYHMKSKVVSRNVSDFQKIKECSIEKPY